MSQNDAPVAPAVNWPPSVGRMHPSRPLNCLEASGVRSAFLSVGFLPVAVLCGSPLAFGCFAALPAQQQEQSRAEQSTGQTATTHRSRGQESEEQELTQLL